MDRSNRTGALGLIAAVFMLLAIAAPAAAATTGTICGEVTAFTAPTAVTDGSITINGTAEDINAGAVVTDAVELTALATLGAFTCVNVVADADGDITELALAAQAQLCGTVSEQAGVFFVNDTALTAEALSLITGDSALSALLDAAANGAGSVCLDLAFNSAGLVTSINLDGTLRLCGTATLDADSVTIAGVDVPLSTLSAEAAAALQVAVDAGADVCVDATVQNTDVVDAAVDATVRLCGTVTFNADGSATVGGVTIPADLIDADVAAALEAAATADGEACVTVDAVSAGGETTVTVVAEVSLCATVEAITASSITAGGVTFETASDLRGVIEVGDNICFDLVTDPDGGVVLPPGDAVITDPAGTPITDPDGTPVDDDATVIDGDGTPGDGDGDGGDGTPADDDGSGTELLPNTAVAPAAPADRSGSFLILGLAAALAAVMGTRLARERLNR